ncbi:von Willebrand factor D and EGF domain-containing protein [Patella vulgata]|uniref:von Willebrand factor D and EGF domain-containing protein n=1 Tax=Patella vulgata TaxID=6465 RepID=UPI002180582C|nr:von Willebrand factor D and EGF domain-containing protein [Patella vulgata]
MKKLIFCIVFIAAVNGQDPCTYAKSFPDTNKRSPTYALKAGETPISDQYIEEGWYGELGVELHSENSPGPNKCGTVYPVYLKDNVTESDNEQDVNLCIHVSNECDLEFTTKMKRCEFITVYYLKRLPLASAGYCAGLLGNKSDYPDYKTANINVTVDINYISPTDQPFLFYCDFKQSTEILWYTVFWYVDDRVIAKSNSSIGSPTVINETKLEEQTLKAKGITSVGFKVKCAVRASFEHDGPLCLSSISEATFIGLEILTPLITIGPNQKDSIRLRPTAPICHSNEANCQLNVEINYPKVDKCDDRAMFGHSNCILDITGTEWDQVFEMEVQLSPAQIYVDRSFIHYIKLRTVALFPPHRIWGNSSIGDIQIHLVPDTRSIETKMCKAETDPHMFTSESNYYEHRREGVFTLYENKEWLQEVQIQTKSCNGEAYCSCGTAIRAGKAVYILNHCEGSWEINYRHCDDRKYLLDVKKKDDKTYTIVLPSSTLITVNLINRHGGNFTNVFITPSYADVNISRGLCGNVNHYKYNPNANERILRNGEASRTTREFSMSWKVTGNITDLFSDDLDNLTSLNYQDFYCNCNPNEDDTNDATNDVTCRRNCGAAFKNHTTIRECSTKLSVKEYRFRREVKHRIVRSVEDMWRSGWTEERAISYCTELFKNSSAVQICKDIPTVDLNGPMNNCIADIKSMGDARCSPIAVESVKTQCYHEVEFNTTLQEETEPGKPSVFNQVKRVACPYECSNKGDCVEGICICEKNYGGSDCSVNISDPPVMEYLSEDGYCDLSDDECSEVSVFGGIFVETENTSCKINYIQMIENNTVQNEEETIHRPDVESISEAICFLPNHSNRRETEKPENEFVKVYKISVANNGIAYSDEGLMVIFNSRCQYCTINGLDVNCSFTGDFCMSGGVCYENGEPHASHKCYVCSVNNGSRSWNYSTVNEE